MVYYKNSENGYIISVETSSSDNEITEEKYNEILTIIQNKPTAPTGYEYKLKDPELEWELVKLPSPKGEEATEEDYKQALNRLGVSTDGEECADVS